MEDFARPAFSERAKIAQEKLSNSGKYIAYYDGPIARLHIKQDCNNDIQDSLKKEK